MEELKKIAVIDTAELIDLVDTLAHEEALLGEVRRIIRSEHASHAYERIAELLEVKETYEQKFAREMAEKREAAAVAAAEKKPKTQQDGCEDASCTAD